MYDFKRLMVCLDQSDMDQTLVRAAAEYAAFGQAEDIYFVTVVRSLEVPDYLHEEFPHLKKPLDEQIEQQMHEQIKGAFEGLSCRFHFDVLEGDPTHQIIHWSRVKEADLIVLGRKQYHIGKGVTSRNIVNIAHSSVLFVNYNARLRPRHILLPTDFSEASRLAYRKAVEIASRVEARLTCLHVYSVPTGYHTTGKTYEEFAEIMLSQARAHFDVFVQEEKKLPDMRVEYVLDRHHNPDRAIAEYASTHPTDLIVIGSRGRTALSSVLLGSVAAKVVESDLDMPVLVVKSKEENMGLIDAILQL